MYLGDDVEDDGLKLLITVGTDPEVEFVRVLASTESLGDTENRIRGGHLDAIKHRGMDRDATGLHLLRSTSTGGDVGTFGVSLLYISTYSECI